MMTNCGKEVCNHCQKYINVGNVVNTCYTCNTIVHTKCAKKMKFVKINNTILCQVCAIGVEIKYNPFYNVYDLDDTSSDIPDDVVKAMSTLENCKAYGGQELITEIDNQAISTSNISLCFNNLDGNKSNFDTLNGSITVCKPCILHIL